MRELERRVVLAVLDHKWREHLYEMDYLREGIGLRAMAQRDPLVEYQREGFDMFNTMMEGIKEESGEAPAVSPAPGPVTDAVAPDGGAPGTSVRDSAPADRAPAGTAPGGDGAAGRGAGGRGGRGSRRRAGGRHAATGRSGGTQAAASPAVGTPSVVAPGLDRPQQPSRLSYSAPTVDGEAQVKRRSAAAAGGEFGKVGRNAPCPCGSGRKYKLCHGDPRNRPDG